ncbi:Zn(II)2Cys6 transcription factor domain-containing protein [Aspergillus foveolatus]|uniref:Zn(II)2Cys6 transcription factor domain-containing protein n=1 Tax=Aspergillus foveolatus TaxID=210207 RepID=UPI003CCCD423
MEAYKTQPPVRKLKDSCDVCSASKLRCDKQKPTCARCANLNRPCTYSPARRGGRPHRVRRERSQSQSQSQSQDQSPRQCFGMPIANTSSSSFAELTRIPGQTDSKMSCNNGCFLSTQMTANPYSQDSQPSTRSAGMSPSPCKNLMNTRVAAETAETDMDCTRVALSIVEQLERSKEQRPRSAASTYTHGGLTATEACQRLLTILMCPCSEQAEVALLVASGCISLMDVVHRSASCSSKPLGHDRSASSSGSPSISSEQDPLMWSWSQPQSFSRSCSLASDSQSQVGDLSKIAKVIVQFTERYCQGAKVAAESRAHWVTRCEPLSR